MLFLVDDALIFDAPWPDGLDPADVPFRQRSVTILRRMGYYDDPTLFNTLTEVEVWSWWNVGVGTVSDYPPGVRPRQAGRSTPYSSLRQ
jgi:hypothetical protein